MYGDWHVEVEEAGDYVFEMRRWPAEAEAAIAGGVEAYQAEDGVFPEGVALPIAQASLTVQGQNRSIEVGTNDEAVSVTVRLHKGRTTIQSVFCDKHGEVLCGVYYLKIRYLG